MGRFCKKNAPRCTKRFSALLYILLKVDIGSLIFCGNRLKSKYDEIVRMLHLLNLDILKVRQNPNPDISLRENGYVINSFIITQLSIGEYSIPTPNMTHVYECSVVRTVIVSFVAIPITGSKLYTHTQTAVGEGTIGI